MQVKRFLGSAWASVVGPSDPRRLLVWTLEAKFAGLMAAPGPRPIDWNVLHTAASDLPVEFPAVRAGSVFDERSATAGLASPKDAERQAAVAAVRRAVALGKVLGCPTVVLEPGLVPLVGEIECEDLGDSGYTWTHERAAALLARRKAARNAALDRACREVFALAKAFPDIDFCLTTGRSLRSVADRLTLQDLYEDLGQLRLGYWHDAAVCARRQQVLGEDPGEWLESFGNRCRGFSLGDASPDGMYLPPGSGGVDYGQIATYVRRTGAPLPVVLELDPSVAPGELPGMRSCLGKYGL
jgi:sugar phosphate isomerase/epimerase